jgi:hypothetical protein
LVERAELDVAELILDDAKANYIAIHHDVMASDIDEVFRNEPRYLVSYKDGKERFAMLGPSKAGRFLTVAIMRTNGSTWRVVTAYWLRESRARRFYE